MSAFDIESQTIMTAKSPALPIENLSIEFHDPSIPLPPDLYDATDGHFGIVKMKVRCDIAIPAGIYLVNMEKDGSGSMTTGAGDGRTRDEHVKATICNAIRALTKIAAENPQAKIFVKLADFDTKVYSVLELTKLSDDNVEYLVSTVMARQLPNGSTNIELALRNSVKSCDEFLAENPDAHIISVITTDGEANAGECNKYKLQDIVKGRPYPTICIGYGSGHNADLMITISSSYFYVADFERAGEPIGEILQNFLYIAMEKSELQILHGEVLHEDQTWSDKLCIGNIIGGTEKTYSVRSKEPETIHALLYGKNTQTTVTHAQVVLAESASFTCYKDLTRDLFRHKTVALLAEARDNLAQTLVRPEHPHYSDNYAADMERYEAELIAFDEIVKKHAAQKKTIRDNLKIFFRSMKEYAKDKNMENEALMKQLLDDVYTVWLSLSARFSHNEARAFTQAKYMCNLRQLSNNTSARTATQTPRPAAALRRQNAGPSPLLRQNALSSAYPDDIDDDADDDSQMAGVAVPRFVAPLRPPMLARTPTCVSHPGMEELEEGEIDEDDDDALVHELTDGAISAYATQPTVALMREVSSARSSI
jgi:predicted DNA-binding ribbon-helix-helix protein